MTDNSQGAQMPTLTPEEGLDYFRDALTTVQQGTAIVCYHDGEDPTNADEDWLEEHRANGTMPDPAAILVPLQVWNDYATMRNTDAAAQQAQARMVGIQVENAAMHSRERGVELAIQANDGAASTNAILLRNAKEIHEFLTTGQTPGTP